MGDILFPFGTPSSMDEVRQLADHVRTAYGHLDDCLNIELLIERDLGMEIVPQKGLIEKADAEAILRWGLKHIVVDEDRFRLARFERRFRFSLAHEVGHVIMHRNLVHLHRPESVEDYLRQNQKTSLYHALFEAQANEFAGRILVPRVNLEGHLRRREKFIQAAVAMTAGSTRALAEILANGLCDLFNVSTEVMTIRLQEEGLLNQFLVNTR